MNEIILKRFETPDETRVLKKGNSRSCDGGLTIGKASFTGVEVVQHVSQCNTALAKSNTSACGLRPAMVSLSDGTEIELSPGNCFMFRLHLATAGWWATVSCHSTFWSRRLFEVTVLVTNAQANP
jgi:hypothetical protein